MREIRSILVPVDFSECSSRALEYAAFLSRRYQATLHLLHVWAPPQYVGAGTLIDADGKQTTLEDFARSRAGDHMRRLLEQIETRTGGEAVARIETGDPTTVVVDLAASGDYDLIVMGTHGRRGISHLVLGSIAEKVVRRATLPVLTVSARADKSAR